VLFVIHGTIIKICYPTPLVLGKASWQMMRGVRSSQILRRVIVFYYSIVTVTLTIKSDMGREVEQEKKRRSGTKLACAPKTKQKESSLTAEGGGGDIPRQRHVAIVAGPLLLD